MADRAVVSLDDWRDSFIESMVNGLNIESTSVLKDLWDIACPIVENIFNIDIDGDGVKDHYKREIWSICKDKMIEWGNDITVVMVDVLDGNRLKQLMAAAHVAKWLSKIGIMSEIPFAGVIINLAIEWIVAGIKSLLKKGKESLHKEVVKCKELFDSVVARFVRHMGSRFPLLDVSTEHYWGTNQFKYFVLKRDAPAESAVTFYGSLRMLADSSEDEDWWAEVMRAYETKIEGVFTSSVERSPQ